ncbi:hypothetical protein [Bremerella alba]|uniref:Uncharacterized protein n=1 Tax=Bremerella alba TaxID=980252 RepID=A0A7V8V524_9BACT|nr:hypothetical protein [Bremerella alba]MBA2115092.1 hypothetical protein [Bremerella alba]
MSTPIETPSQNSPADACEGPATPLADRILHVYQSMQAELRQKQRQIDRLQQELSALDEAEAREASPPPATQRAGQRPPGLGRKSRRMPKKVPVCRPICPASGDRSVDAPSDQPRTLQSERKSCLSREEEGTGRLCRKQHNQFNPASRPSNVAAPSERYEQISAGCFGHRLGRRDRTWLYSPTSGRCRKRPCDGISNGVRCSTEKNVPADYERGSSVGNGNKHPPQGSLAPHVSNVFRYWSPVVKGAEIATQR